MKITATDTRVPPRALGGPGGGTTQARQSSAAPATNATSLPQVRASVIRRYGGDDMTAARVLVDLLLRKGGAQ